MIAVGPFGGAQGTSHDMTGTSKKLQSVTVYSSKDGAGGHINGISFSYENDQGSTTSVDTWGTAAGSKATFTIPAGAYLANLSGTFDNNVKSLTLSPATGSHTGRTVIRQLGRVSRYQCIRAPSSASLLIPAGCSTLSGHTWVPSHRCNTVCYQRYYRPEPLGMHAGGHHDALCCCLITQLCAV
ncbi:hypothetical protein PAHAL_J024400 [Panicum hallii]|uniref:Jacalin-type lectin domain-containing protein n=1 Tax=Panicum hallii TaxID=206008 RepID=A0A2T7A9V2_9POAL|nr:hypothetical protein PAHAL_J024400 [Panicum hallii]